MILRPISIGQVIDIGEFRLTASREYKHSDICHHHRVTMHPEGEYLTCDDCEKPVSAYWFLGDFFARYQTHREYIETRKKEMEEAEKRTVILRAAQQVEDVWRRRKFNPCCPHCHKPIGPEDGFGREQIRIVPRRLPDALAKIDATPLVRPGETGAVTETK